MSDGRFAGRVALVTGAGAGIGRQAALRLAAEGAAVAIGDLKDYEQAAEEIREAGGRSLGVPMDVTDGAAVRAAVEQVVRELGGLQVLVNNAGVGWPRTLAELTEGEWDTMLAVNLKSVFLCSQAALPHLEGGGAIVNLASLAGRSSSPIQACAYSAAKAGVLGLTRHLARELGPRGIRVNAVCPGPIETGFLDRTMPPGLGARLAEQIPLGRIGRPEEIARVVAFLASDDAAYITGAGLDVNGGIFMA